MDRKKLEQLIFDTCSVEPDYPWMDTPESAVFRHPGNRKWFALVTTVSRSKLGLPGQQPVDIVNLKCDPPPHRFPADGAGLLPGLPYEQGQLDHGSVGRQCTG